MVLSSGPVETKVSAATIGAAASAFIMWLLRTYVFHGALPAEVEAFASVVVIAAVTFAAGWFARHTPRTDLDATGRHARRGG